MIKKIYYEDENVILITKNDEKHTYKDLCPKNITFENFDYMPNTSDSYSSCIPFKFKGKMKLYDDNLIEHQPVDILAMNDINYQENIRKKAYYNWTKAGCPEGKDLYFWTEAEKEIENELSQWISLNKITF